MEAICAIADASVLNTGTPDGEKIPGLPGRGRRREAAGGPGPGGRGGQPLAAGPGPAAAERLLSGHPPGESGGGQGPAGRHRRGTGGGQPSARQQGGPAGRRRGAGPAVPDGGAALRAGGPGERRGAGLVRHRRQQCHVPGHRHRVYALSAVRRVRRRGAGRGPPPRSWPPPSGRSGARRAERLAGGRGSGSFRTALMDAAGTLTAADAAREAEIAPCERRRPARQQPGGPFVSFPGPLLRSRAGRLSLSRAPYSRAFISNISSKDRM